MKALTWKQPYAALMAFDKIETRNWETKYRGQVLICASKTPYTVDAMLEMGGMYQFRRISSLLENNELYKIKGKAIAIGELVDCRPMTKADEDACFVKFKEGLWCHIYENVRLIEPFDFKGGQGWRNLTPELINSIRYL